MAKKQKKKRAPQTPKPPVSGSGLRWLALNDFYLIPPYLVEQIEGRDYEVQRLYELAPALMRSADCLLGVFVDTEHKIKGFMWAGVNPLSRRLTVHALSIDPEFQKRGIVKQAKVILDDVVKRLGLRGFVFMTSQPEKFTSAGINPSGLVQMEI